MMGSGDNRSSGGGGGGVSGGVVAAVVVVLLVVAALAITAGLIGFVLYRKKRLDQQQLTAQATKRIGIYCI